MISVQQASQFFTDHLRLNKATLNEAIRADRDYPPFDRVMMDGIAVAFEAFAQGLRAFKVEGIQAAGEASKILTDKKSCLEVMTGAPLPRGCDLVIPYEHLEIVSGVATITRELERERFQNIHAKGSDCKQGEIVLKAGAAFNGPHQGIAASMGVDFNLSRSSKILIISTGDELVEIHQAPLEHQIRRSNVYALKASLELNGYTQVSMDHLKDDALAVAQHYEKNAPHFDVMIYSGGVSKGKFDYLPGVWMEMGVTRYFHQVAQRPGKPLWFGQDEKQKTLVIGLPGNPVSSLVCLHRYVIPARKMFVKLAEEIVFKNDLTFFVPAKLDYNADGTVWASPLKIKNSGEFTALAESDGFLELPAEGKVFAKGEAYAFWPWRNL